MLDEPGRAIDFPSSQATLPPKAIADRSEVTNEIIRKRSEAVELVLEGRRPPVEGAEAVSKPPLAAERKDLGGSARQPPERTRASGSGERWAERE